MEEIDWLQEANCRGMNPNLFFPHQGASAQEALEVCSDCPVKVPCLQEALSRREPGIRGGTTERERRRVRRLMALGEIASETAALEYLIGVENGVYTFNHKRGRPNTNSELV